ncbi:Dolichyl-phosphate-mannose-protein mannosyltransferase [Geodermatophilus africanus]|uniref:Dolichyl-phosphate-mannose-protein mannosyltransferase n=1 Tax=Geodermatophilus africanus TaxID=1137993 RepID=A0A1H3Q5P2_9ACTN|nr:phospholipid carrier-dependent glycosyltransferase [Geodermatophilus africanus]SDZ08580.1 Dolichyl-phosphate-mannose-protein mannosyltransferase [Geodermatophilus africanus]
MTLAADLRARAAGGPALRVPRALVAVRDGWVNHSSPVVLAAAVAGVALGVRSFGLVHGFELWVDEMLYADLGASAGRGEMPRLADGPFFLHPPGFFLIAGAVIRVLGLETADSMTLVYDLRWLTAVLGALTVALAFLLIRRIAGTAPALWVAAVLVVEPFVLRNNSRVFLETSACLFVIAGLLVVIDYLAGPERGRWFLRLLGGGVLAGYGVMTKDVLVVFAVLPVLVAVLWRHTLRLREAAVFLVGSALPYTLYLSVLWLTGYLGNWIEAKQQGLARLSGEPQISGFNAPNAPSLVSRLIEEAQQYATSYVLLAICPLAGLIAAFSRHPGRRLVGLAAMIMGMLGLYLAAFGTLEEQFGYPVVLASVMAIAIAPVELACRWPVLRRPATVLMSLFLAAAVFMGLRLELADDDGFLQYDRWAAEELPAGARVGVTNDTSARAFGLDPRYGLWTTAPLLHENGAQYVLTVSHPIEQGYAMAHPELLSWLERHATVLFLDRGETNGETLLWFIDRETLERGAADGVGGPPPEALDAGTGGQHTSGSHDGGP